MLSRSYEKREVRFRPLVKVLVRETTVWPAEMVALMELAWEEGKGRCGSVSSQAMKTQVMRKKLNKRHGLGRVARVKGALMEAEERVPEVSVWN
jgi:hypothetical protein